jgi:hypothetical protein
MASSKSPAVSAGRFGSPAGQRFAPEAVLDSAFFPDQFRSDWRLSAVENRASFSAPTSRGGSVSMFELRQINSNFFDLTLI